MRILTAGNSASASDHVTVECRAIRPEDQRSTHWQPGAQWEELVRFGTPGGPWEREGVKRSGSASRAPESTRAAAGCQR